MSNVAKFLFSINSSLYSFILGIVSSYVFFFVVNSYSSSPFIKSFNEGNTSSSRSIVMSPSKVLMVCSVVDHSEVRESVVSPISIEVVNNEVIIVGDSISDADSYSVSKVLLSLVRDGNVTSGMFCTSLKRVLPDTLVLGLPFKNSSVSVVVEDSVKVNHNIPCVGMYNDYTITGVTTGLKDVLNG